MENEHRSIDAAPPLSDSAVAALQRGDKIAAIKIVRAERNLGLKEAKDAVDDYVHSQPALQSTLAAVQAETRRRALRWLAVIAALAMVAYWTLSRG